MSFQVGDHMLGHTLQFHQDLPEPALSIYQTAHLYSLQ